MTRLGILALLLLAPTPVIGGEGDYVLVHGAVTDRGATVIVLKADSGKTYYVSADPGAVSRVRAGEMVAIRGTEGALANEVKAEGIDPDAARRPDRPPAATPAGTLAHKDWRLPAGSRYEVYNPASGTYAAVDLASLPGRLDAGEPIFDRTLGQWVQHPSVGGRNKAYLEGGTAAAGDTIVHGDWTLPRNNRYETYEASSGRYLPVDAASVPARLDRGSLIYDRTANRWVQHPSLGGSSPYRAARVQGRVQAVQGGALTLLGEDGKLVTVDVSKLKAEALRGLRWGQHATVTGAWDAGKTRFSAQGVETR